MNKREKGMRWVGGGGAGGLTDSVTNSCNTPVLMLTGVNTRGDEGGGGGGGRRGENFFFLERWLIG